MKMLQTVLSILLISVLGSLAGGHVKGEDNGCHVKVNEQGIPINFIPPNTDLVLLAVARGYRAYRCNEVNATVSFWVEVGRQDCLYQASDLQTIIGDISSDWTTLSVGSPYVVGHTYFADGSWLTRQKPTNVYTNYFTCDPKSITPELYEVEASSDYPGVFTGVTYVALYGTYGGAPPLPSDKNCKEGDVFISPEIIHYAYFRGSVSANLTKEAEKEDHQQKGYPHQKGNQHQKGDQHDQHQKDNQHDQHQKGDQHDQHQKGDQHDQHQKGDQHGQLEW